MHEVQQRGGTVHCGGHRHDSRDAPVLCRDRDAVAGRVRSPPQSDPVAVDAGQVPHSIDGCVVVLALAADRDVLAKCAFGGAEPAVVENERVQAGISEGLGEAQQAGVAGTTEAAGHDDTGPSGRPGQRVASRRDVPGRAADPVAGEGEVGQHHPAPLRKPLAPDWWRR